MAGVLLRSGSVKNFLPLGATGNPVYSAASQLHAAMRRHLGPEMADYFAIPKQDEKGETIDWYSAFDGSVVPWTAATPEERSEAKARLLAAQQKLREKSRALQNAEDSEQQVFGKLLELATRIPGEDHVYLVDGRPVMTFWGFSERDALADQDVLAGLDTGGSLVTADETALPAEAEVGETVARKTALRSRWLTWPWLLPPLLLMLLLLWFLLVGLRSCVSGWPPRVELIWPERKEDVAPVKKEDPKDAEKEYGDRGVEEHSKDGSLGKETFDGRTVVDEDGVVRRTGKESVDFDSTYDGSARTRDAVDRDATEERTGKDATEDTGRTDEERADTEGTEASDDTTEKPSNTDNTTGDGGEGEGKGDDTADDATSPDKDTDQERQGPSKDMERGTKSDSTGNTRDSGQPLVIPPDAAKKGSTDFMNGSWRSVTGLQDAAGNPVQLEYQFKGGKGTAKLRRSVGGREQECTAAVQPSFQGSRLVIDQAEDIRCPDGSTFQRSSVECSTNPQGRAECKGKNQDGSSYQVRINKK